MNENEETNFIAYEPCPECQRNGYDTTGDNLARYSDGHGFCFSCKYYQHNDELKQEEVKQVNTNMIKGEYTSLTKRKIDEVTCKVFARGVPLEDGWARQAVLACVEARAQHSSVEIFSRTQLLRVVRGA